MACLDLLVPGHPPPDTQILLPPLHSRRSILSPEKKCNIHTISILAYMKFTQTTSYNSGIEVIEANKFRFLNIKLFLIKKLVTHIRTSKFYSQGIT
jgi:hypothetical protein